MYIYIYCIYISYIYIYHISTQPSQKGSDAWWQRRPPFWQVQLNKYKKICMDVWTYGFMDRCVDGFMDGLMDVWMDERMWMFICQLKSSIKSLFLKTVWRCHSFHFGWHTRAVKGQGNWNGKGVKAPNDWHQPNSATWKQNVPNLFNTQFRQRHFRSKGFSEFKSLLLAWQILLRQEIAVFLHSPCLWNSLLKVFPKSSGLCSPSTVHLLDRA